ncbi:hypothetical protein ACFX2A_014643 [Malus domestica]
MQARSVGVVCSFNSCRQGAFGVVCSFNSCRQGAFGAVLQFQLVQARSLVSYSLGSCGQGALCRVAVSARAGEEPCVLQFRLLQARSLVSYSLGSCGQGALLNLSSNFGEAFLTIFIARSLDRVIEEVFG